MRRVLIAFSLVLAACAGGTAEPSTTPIGTTPPPPAPSTTEFQQPVQIQNCTSPPITFGTLCEVYELLEDWHVDRPLDPAVLAEVALEGLTGFQTEETAPLPRTLFCAIPHQDFTTICDELGHRMTVGQIPPTEAIEAAVAHMADFGLDPFTYYVPPEQAANFRLNGIVGGIGVLLDARDAVGSKCAQITPACPLTVVTVLQENPGAEAGLQPGDVITQIDGTTVVGLGFSSSVALIAGDETGTVSLTIDRGGAIQTLSIDRRELTFPSVDVSLPQSGVGYIRIPDFEADITPLVTQGLNELDGLYDTLVVDLRDNPGGFINTVIEVASLFVDGGTVMISEAPDERIEHTASAGGAATSSQLIVLVNSGTASAAEVLAGALRDRRGAIVVGANTFGKDTVQIAFDLRNGGQLLVAVARWSTPAGETVVDGGLTPDRVVDWPESATIDDIVALALEAAS